MTTRVNQPMSDKPLYQTIAEMLTQQIDSGEYQAGARLPAERELADQFGVSRVTIREAEIALQARGRVTIKPGSGVYVADMVKRESGAFPEISAFELTEARALFESEAAALATAQITDEALGDLEKLVEVMTECQPGDKDAEAADHQFHRTIAAASNNAAITYVIEKLWEMRDEIEPIKSVHESVCTADPAARSREHGAILDAMKARDPAAARGAMRDHFHRLLESMIDATHEQAIKALNQQITESRNRYLKPAVL